MQAGGLCDLDLARRVDGLDSVDDRLRNAAGNGELARVRACLGERLRLLGRDALLVHALGGEHAEHLLKGEDEVNIAAHGAAAGLELLRVAGADEHNLAAWVSFLYKARGEHHGRHRDGYVLGHVGEHFFDHVAPRGAAGGDHEAVLGRNLLKEVGGLLDDAQISADRGFVNVGEAQALEGCGHLLGRCVGAELADEGRREHDIDGHAAFYCHDGLEDLAFIAYRTERAVYKALSAGCAFFIIYRRAAKLVLADGRNAAGLLAWALLTDDRRERASVHTSAAAHALVGVDMCMSVYLADRLFGAYLNAGVLDAALTAVCDLDDVIRAAVAREFDDVYQRRLVILLGNDGLLDAVGNIVVHAELAHRQTHCKAQPFADNGTLDEQIVSEWADLIRVARTDLVRKLFKPLRVISSLVCHARDFSENLVPYPGFAGLHSSHGGDPPIILLFSQK